MPEEVYITHYIRFRIYIQTHKQKKPEVVVTFFYIKVFYLLFSFRLQLEVKTAVSKIYWNFSVINDFKILQLVTRQCPKL